MPEMERFCGTVQRVFKRVDKIIDIIEYTGLRRMTGTVTLDEVRCDGSGHGGCQTGCQILWKEDWLRRCSSSTAGDALAADPAGTQPSEAPLRIDCAGTPVDVYRCQATELFRASKHLRKWDPRQYLAPLWSGNVSVAEFLKRISLDAFNVFQRIRRGSVYPLWTGGTLERTPTIGLGLRPGEWVRVKTKEEIQQTLDKRNRNRGLWFDREMLRYCGGRFRVFRRVDRLIEERSGKLVQLKTPAVILDGVTARGDFYRFNPQNDYILWREIWLQRLNE
jgi:hypothetical protein